MTQENEYKLPLFARIAALKPIPGQAPDAGYAVTAALPGPDGGLGYLVRTVARRRVRVLAWIGRDMKVFPTDAPLTRAPEGAGELHFDPWTDIPDSGAVRVQSSDGLDKAITLGEYKLDGERASLTACSIDLGDYARGAHPLGELLAACWIGGCLLPRLAGRRVGAGAGRICELFRDMMDKPLPDALDELIWRGATRSADAAPFERYAARQLVEAGAGEIRQIAGEHSLDVVRLDSTNMFWMRFDDDEIEGLQRDVVLAVEAALDRLSFVDLDARDRDNGMGLVSTFDERECFRSASDALHMWAKHARFVQEQSGAPNPAQTVRGTTAARGGMWDVITRFSAICERLILPFRLEYRCDVAPAQGRMAVVCSVPTAMMMPASDLTDAGWVDVRERRAGRAASYALRLAGLLAQAAFTAGVRVTAVDVTARAGSLTGDPVLCVGFDRAPFQMDVAARYVAGRFDDPAQDDDPAAIARLLDPARSVLRFGADRGLRPVDPPPLDPALAAQRVPLWRDDRPLPERLRGVLRADLARELDVMHDDGVVKGQEIWDIVAQNEDSPLSAMLEVESALMQIEAASPDHGDRAALYCEHPLMRLLVDEAPGAPTDRYWKAPDAMFNAHGALGRLARESGELDKAMEHAEAMIRLGPTTAQGFIDLSLDHTENGEDYAKASDALIRALRVAVMPIDVGFVYYRLAYALWRTNNLDAALACYAMVLTMPEGPFHDKSRNEVPDLLAQLGVEKVPDRESAERTLRGAGIPVAPGAHTLERLAKAAITLVDAGFPLAADEAVWLLSIMQSGDVLPALRRCLRFGVAHPRDVLASER